LIISIESTNKYNKPTSFATSRHLFIKAKRGRGF